VTSADILAHDALKERFSVVSCTIGMPSSEKRQKIRPTANEVRTEMGYCEPVVVFTAPPCSGKTHVIALCAAYLHSHGVSTCIVTPNNELRLFANELSRLDCPSTASLPVLNIGSYLMRRHQFEYVFIDEAHNIRSAVELDPYVVRTIHLETGEPVFDISVPVQRIMGNVFICYRSDPRVRSRTCQLRHLLVKPDTARQRFVQEIIRLQSGCRSEVDRAILVGIVDISRATG